MERSLVSIQRVDMVLPIEFTDKDTGIRTLADNIDKAVILGWACVVKKGDFKAGDNAIYFEIDSLIPKYKQFEFLGEVFPYRLRTKRLKGVLSQGLLMPVSAFPLVSAQYPNFNSEDMIGTDLTALMGVVKYEPPETAHTSGMLAGSFPGYVPRTDETRIQSVPRIIEEMYDEPVYVTTKLNGTSFTALLDRDNGELWVCSRNNRLKDDGINIYWKMAHKYNIQDVLNKISTSISGAEDTGSDYESTYYGKCIALQGEVCGMGIMKNTLGLTEHKLFIFNAYDYNMKRHLNFDELMDVIKISGLPSVFDYPWSTCLFNRTMDEWLELAKGNYPNTNNPREGIVIRSITNRYSEVLEDRFSIKVVNNDYLLKGGD